MANPKILICDDEEGIRESLKLVLGDHYNLVTVDSGDMAVDFGHQPDFLADLSRQKETIRAVIEAGAAAGMAFVLMRERIFF